MLETVQLGRVTSNVNWTELRAVARSVGMGLRGGFSLLSARAASDGLTTVLTCVVMLHHGMHEGARDSGRDLKGEGGTARVGE